MIAIFMELHLIAKVSKHTFYLILLIPTFFTLPIPFIIIIIIFFFILIKLFELKFLVEVILLYQPHKTPFQH